MQKEVTKCVELNLLPLTHVKECILSDTSSEFTSAANDMLIVLTFSDANSSLKLHHLTYDWIRSKYQLPSQLVMDARKEVWSHDAYSFRNLPLTFNVPRSGALKTTERGNPVFTVTTSEGRIGLPIRRDGAWKRFQGFAKDGWKFTMFKLLRRGERWVAQVSLRKEFEIREPAKVVVGVDMGTNVLAAITVYDGSVKRQLYFGQNVAHIKRNICIRRSKLQSHADGSSRARRALRKLRGYERNFDKTVAYQVAHKIVELAKRHGGFVAIEDLRGLRGSRLSRKSNRKVRRTPYHIFREAIQQVAWQNGIFVKKVNPRHTSKRCSRCGEIGMRKESTFKCKCGYTANADRNASVNIAQIALGAVHFNTNNLSQTSESRVAVNRPLRSDERICAVHDIQPLGMPTGFSRG